MIRQKSKFGLSGQGSLLIGLLIAGILSLLYLLTRKNRLDRVMMNPKKTVLQSVNEIVRWLTTNTNLSERSAYWIAGQAVHETGGFTSNIFKENKNLFGMKLPVKRQTLAIGTNRGHATFRTYEESLKDLILYLQEFKNNPDDQPTLYNWIDRLKRNKYFEDSLTNYYNNTLIALPEKFRQIELQALRDSKNTLASGWKTILRLLTGLNI